MFHATFELILVVRYTYTGLNLYNPNASLKLFSKTEQRNLKYNENVKHNLHHTRNTLQLLNICHWIISQEVALVARKCRLFNFMGIKYTVKIT